jgi:hypothetical protein
MSAATRERPHEEWHAALRAGDESVHAAEDARMAREAVAALEARLTQANADRHALSSAVGFRDGLLADLTRALVERDASVARLEGDVRALHAELARRRNLPRRVVGRARRELGRVLGRRS